MLVNPVITGYQLLGTIVPNGVLQKLAFTGINGSGYNSFVVEAVGVQAQVGIPWGFVGNANGDQTFGSNSTTMTASDYLFGTVEVQMLSTNSYVVRSNLRYFTSQLAAMNTINKSADASFGYPWVAASNSLPTSIGIDASPFPYTNAIGLVRLWGSK